MGKTRNTANLVSDNNISIDIVNDRIGIGSVIPTSKFDVLGDSKFTGVVTATAFVGNLTGNLTGNSTNVVGGIGSITQLQVTGVSTFTNGPISIGAATSTGTVSQSLQVTGGAYVSGNVGTGITNPTSKLHVIGDVIVSGIITAMDFNSTSDINLKQNICTLNHSLQVIQNIRGVKFEWKETHKPSIGVIAQEVEKVLPELINGSETKSVNYNGLIGLLIEAVKEHNEIIEVLKEKINVLERKLSQPNS